MQQKQGAGNEGLAGIIRQALMTGAIVGVILLTVAGAMWLTRQFETQPAPAASLVVAPVATDTPVPPATATQPPRPTATATASLTLAPPAPTATIPTPTDTPPLPTPTFTRAPAETQTSAPPAETPTSEESVCPPPAGWQPYVVQESDTLTSILFRYPNYEQLILDANCLDIQAQLQAGDVIFVPPLSVGPSPTPCAPPANWTRYIVRAGNTLSQLAAACGVSVNDVMSNNCLSSTQIYAGQTIYLPCVPRIQPPTSVYIYYPTSTPRPYYPPPTPRPTVRPPTRPPAPTPVPTRPPAPRPTQVIIPPTSTPTLRAGH
jgi:LysM repeat protein